MRNVDVSINKSYRGILQSHRIVCLVHVAALSNRGISISDKAAGIYRLSNERSRKIYETEGTFDRKINHLTKNVGENKVYRGVLKETRNGRN